MKIDRIAFQNDLEGYRGFFIKYFSLKSNECYYNETTLFRSCFISFDEGAHLELMTRLEFSDGGKELVRVSYIRLAFSVGSKEGVNRLTVQLKAGGWNIISDPRITGAGYDESAIVGIENKQIEITV